MGDTLPPEVDRKVPGKPATGSGGEEATLHNGDVEADKGCGDSKNCLLKDINCSQENHTMKKVNGCGDNGEERWTEDCDRRSNSSPLSKNDADNQMDWEDSRGSGSNPIDSLNSIDNVQNGEDRESMKNTQNGLLDNSDSREAENNEPETLDKTDSVKTISSDECENDSVINPKTKSVASPAHQQDLNNCVDNSDSKKDNCNLLSEGKNDCSNQNDEGIVQNDNENDRMLLGEEDEGHPAKVDLSEVGSASVNDSEKSTVHNQEDVIDCDDVKSDKDAKSDEPSKSAEVAIPDETSLSEKAVKSEEATKSDNKSQEHAEDVENRNDTESSSATAEKISQDSDETKVKSMTSDTVEKMDTESEVSVSSAKGDKPSDNADEKKDDCKKRIVSVEVGKEKASESILKGKIPRVANENMPLRKGPPVSSQRTPVKNVPKRKSEPGSPAKPVTVSEVKDFRPVAKILVDLGTDLVRQHIYKDLIKIQSAKQSKAKLTEKETAQLETLKKAHKDVALKNDDLVMDLVHCPLCLFKTESLNVMEWHKECAHMRMVGVYMCAFCQYDTKQILHFIAHVKAKHNRNGRLDLRLSNHLCPLCPFEDNSIRPYRRHIRKCEKAFFPRRNLMPSPADCDIPIKSLPAPVVKTTEKRAWSKQPRNTVSSHLAGVPTKASLTAPGAQARPPTALSSTTQFRGIAPGSSGMFISPIQQPIAQQRGLLPTAGTGGMMATMGTQYYALLNQLGQPMLQTAFRQGPVRMQYQPAISQPSALQTLPVSNVMSMYQPRATVSSPAVATTKVSTSNQVKAKAKDKPKPVQKPKPSPVTAKSKTPVATGKASTPASASVVSRSLGQEQASMFHVCEICGGYVKDRESLRIHFYWAHRVDIHKDVFQRDPQLFCKSCPMRFWTYQGLSRHRQLVHPNKEKQPEQPAVSTTNQKGSCYLCGTKDLVDLNVHLMRQHKTSIQGLVDTTFAKSKCYFCGLDFKQPQYAVILVHLQENHGQFTKEVKIPDPSVMKPKPFSAVRAVGAITPIRNNTPGRATKAATPTVARSAAPVPTGMFKNSSIVPANSPKPPSTPKPTPKVCKFLCFECDKEFALESDYERHCTEAHQYSCTRCTEQFQSQPLLEKHYSESHRGQKIRCPLCDDNVPMGRPFLRHMKREHIKECSVVIPRLARDKFDLHMAQMRKWEEVKLQKKQGEEKKKKEMAESKKKALDDDEVIVIDLDDTPDDEPPPAKKPKVGKLPEDQNKEVVEEVIEINGEKVKIVQEG